MDATQATFLPASSQKQAFGVPAGLPWLKASAVWIVGLCLLVAGRSRLVAQELHYAVSDSQADAYGSPPYSAGDALQRTRQPLGPGQLEQLVAPIALYPDALVAQILAASTYPQQISEADAFRQQWANASPEQIADEADAQPWDPSVKALTAFPQVLAQMDRNLRWTSDLGNAYYNQPEDVLEAVQIMRGRARSAGNLQTTPQQLVSYNDGYIQLAPANPQVVYVPAYNPWTVYGEPIAPYPGFTLLGVLGQIFSATPLRYGLGIAMAAFAHTPWGWLAWGLNWLTHALLFDHSTYSSQSNTVADWGFRHSGFHAYAGRGGFGRAGFAHAEVQGEGWRHAGSGGEWHSTSRGGFGENRSEGWHSFSGDNGFREDRRGGAAGGFESFRATRGVNRWSNPGSYNRADNTRMARAGFDRAPASAFGGRRSDNWSSTFGSRGSRSESSGSPRAISGRPAQSRALRLTSGRSSKSFSGKGWGGFHSNSGGRAPKTFGGGKGFGGSHSRGGGHSGGHGGGSRHHR